MASCCFGKKSGGQGRSSADGGMPHHHKESPAIAGLCSPAHQFFVPGAGFLLLVVFDILPCVLAFAPVDDFMFAPVVVDEPVELDVWCLVVCCLYVLADATKGDPARPAITSAVIVRLLFIMVRNSSLHSPGRQLIAGG
jgi:hypothetical protein